MSNGALLIDDNGKPVLGLQNDATGQVIPVHVGAVVTGVDGKQYAKLDVNATVTATNPSVGTDGTPAPASSTQIGGTDGTNLRPVTVAIFHNSDSQSLPIGSYGILTGGIAQIVNASGTVDRQRGTGFDGVPAVGIATGAQQLAGPALSTTFGAGGVTGNASAQNVLVASTASMKAGDIIVTQDNVEYVEILSIVDATHCNGIFKNNHAAGQSLTWYHYNQARDATVGDATPLTGMGASATYLYNNVNATLEFDRSANGEKDGASGQGTAVAAEYEFNGGGPVLSSGLLSGYAFDRARNVQAKAVQTATLTATTAGDTVLKFTSAAATNTVQPGAPVLLSVGNWLVAANQKEVVYVSASWVPGSAANVPLQSPVVNTGSTQAVWEIYQMQGPGLSGFTAFGVGIEEEALFDPVTQAYYIERSATQDAVVPQNVVMESPALWNGATMDRWQGKNGAGYIARNAQTVLNQASAAQTATGNSGDLTVGQYTEISIDINVTANSGTSQTLTFFWDRKGADGNYYPLWQSAQQTTTNNQISTSIGAGMAYAQSLGTTGRLRWVLTGTSPSYTFSASVIGK